MSESKLKFFIFDFWKVNSLFINLSLSNCGLLKLLSTLNSNLHFTLILSLLRLETNHSSFVFNLLHMASLFKDNCCVSKNLLHMYTGIYFFLKIANTSFDIKMYTYVHTYLYIQRNLYQ